MSDFTAVKTGSGYMVTQYHEGKQVAQQYVHDLLAWLEAIGESVSIEVKE